MLLFLVEIHFINMVLRGYRLVFKHPPKWVRTENSIQHFEAPCLGIRATP